MNLVVHKYLPALIKIRLQAVCLSDLSTKRYSTGRILQGFNCAFFKYPLSLIQGLFSLTWHRTLLVGSNYFVFPWGCYCWSCRLFLLAVWAVWWERKEGEGVLLPWQKWGTSLKSQITLMTDSGLLLPLLLLRHVLSKEEFYHGMVCLLVKKNWNFSQGEN